MSTESVGSCGSFLQPRKLFEDEEYLEENLQIAPAQMNNPFSSPRQQEGHFRNTVSDGVSPCGAVSIPSDCPVIPMTIAQNTHGAVYSPSSQDGHFTRDHNTFQPTKVPTSQNTPEAVSPDGYNRNKCFISGAGGSGSPDRQATREMNGEDVPKIQCRCGSGTCIVRTSHTEKNPNRRFYKCPAKIKCDFFQWCDGLGPSSQSPLKPGQGYSRSPGKIINPQIAPLEPKEPTCSCKAGPCIVQTMHQGENKDRKYYACPIRRGHGACKHFEWVDSLVKPPETETESNSKRNENNISIVDVTTPEPKQTLSPYESVKDLFGENDMRTVDFWCKEQDPNSTAATGTEISKQLSPGKRPHPHQSNTMGEISPMKRLNLSDAFQVAENCRNCGKRGQCIECPVLTCFKDDDFSENKQGNAMDGGNISLIKGRTSVQNISPGSLKKAGKCFNCGKEGHWRLECTSPRGTNSACFKCGKAGHWMKNCNL